MAQETLGLLRQVGGRGGQQLTGQHEHGLAAARTGLRRSSTGRGAC